MEQILIAHIGLFRLKATAGLHIRRMLHRSHVPDLVLKQTSEIVVSCYRAPVEVMQNNV